MYCLASSLAGLIVIVSVIGGAKVYNLGGLKGEGAYLTDHSLTMHLFCGSAPQDTQIFGGLSPPSLWYAPPMVSVIYLIYLTIQVTCKIQ